MWEAKNKELELVAEEEKILNGLILSNLTLTALPSEWKYGTMILSVMIKLDKELSI